MPSISINTEALRNASVAVTGSLGVVDDALSAIKVANNEVRPMRAVAPELSSELAIARHDLIKISQNAQALASTLASIAERYEATETRVAALFAEGADGGAATAGLGASIAATIPGIIGGASPTDPGEGQNGKPNRKPGPKEHARTQTAPRNKTPLSEEDIDKAWRNYKNAHTKDGNYYGKADREDFARALRKAADSSWDDEDFELYAELFFISRADYWRGYSSAARPDENELIESAINFIPKYPVLTALSDINSVFDVIYDDTITNIDELAGPLGAIDPTVKDEAQRQREDLLKLRDKVRSDPATWDRLSKMGYSIDDDPLRLRGFELDGDALFEFGKTGVQSIPGTPGIVANTLGAIDAVDQYNQAKADHYVRYHGPLANGLDSFADSSGGGKFGFRSSEGGKF